MKLNKLTIITIAILAIVSLNVFFIYMNNKEVKPIPSKRVQQDTQYNQGEDLFVKNCIGCHAVDMKNTSTAPPLGGITKKRAKRWLYGYTRNANNIIYKNDPIKKEGWALMTEFPELTNKEIDAIYYFVEQRYQMTLNGVPIKKYFRFDEKENNKAKICQHIINDKKTILYAYHPKSKEWYFGCDKEHQKSEWKRITLHQVFDLDETISDIDVLPIGFIAKRKSKEMEWEYFMK
ncbi:MAG: cytochrome c [Bacteroidota bacterium]